MKQIELPENLLEYMLGDKGFVFVDDFDGWGIETEVVGFTRERAMEGHQLTAVTSGEVYCPQYSYLRKGNHLQVDLRDRTENWRDTLQKVKLGELPLFKDFPVVIQTSGEKLEAIAPVFETKQDLIIFLALLENTLKKMGYWESYQASHKIQAIQKLTIFLYKNNPNKAEVPSIFDGL